MRKRKFCSSSSEDKDQIDMACAGERCYLLAGCYLSQTLDCLNFKREKKIFLIQNTVKKKDCQK